MGQDGGEGDTEEAGCGMDSGGRADGTSGELDKGTVGKGNRR